MDEYSDQRVKDLPLMSSPFPTLFICLSYAYFVKVLGPKLMENRKPFQLRYVLIGYNLFQVLFSFYLFKESFLSGWGNNYSFRCQPVDYSNSPNALRTLYGCYWYYISKFTEFFDTIFFVLRKKNNQITNLHVIHHGIMPFSVWFGVKFTPGGHSTFFGFLNTAVHIVMYTYYFLAALGPQYQKYLWWKKYLTILQMIQFVLVMTHGLQLAFIECDYPKGFVWFIGGHAMFFFILFANFYKKAYRIKYAKKLEVNSTNKSQSYLKHICFPNQSQLYDEFDQKNNNLANYSDISENNMNIKSMKTTQGYYCTNTNDLIMRNRVFLNKS